VNKNTKSTKRLNYEMYFGLRIIAPSDSKPTENSGYFGYPY
jgi:hypothetical protein